MYRYRSWRVRPLEEPQQFSVDRRGVEDLLDKVEALGRTQLSEVEALKVFEAYGIPTVPHQVVLSEERAVQAADVLGYPVVLKVLSPDVVHKTESGGVKLGLETPAEVGEAYRSILRSVKAAQPDAKLEGILVERYLEGGREVIVGMSSDPRFGPILMFGLGGVYVEALKDVAFGVQPITRTDAEEMIRSLRSFPLLEGLRGEERSDLSLLAEVMQRVSQLVGDHHRIQELDINPFLSFPDGGMAADARIRIREGKSVYPGPVPT
jgi:acetyltransferase